MISSRRQAAAGIVAVLLAMLCYFAGGSDPDLALGADPRTGQRHREQTAVDPRNTYVLAIGCCVPWMGARSCNNSADIFVKTAVSRLGIPKNNVIKVFGKQATFEGVEKGFERLATMADPKSAVIVYYSGHGVLLPDGEGGHHEVFCLWSEEYPFAGVYAVARKVWMTDRQFGRLVEEVPGVARVVISDSCHSDAAWKGLKRRGEKVDYGLKASALMAAAEAGEIAYAGPKYDYFTEFLTNAMKSDVPNLKGAFFLAKRKLLEAAKELCERMRKSGSKKPCLEQIPTIDDPMNVVPLFKIISGPKSEATK